MNKSSVRNTHFDKDFVVALQTHTAQFMGSGIAHRRSWYCDGGAGIVMVELVLYIIGDHPCLKKRIKTY